MDAGVNDLTAAPINETLEAQGIPALDSGVHKIMVEPTMIIECGPAGAATTLDWLHEFPPGTGNAAALTKLGYTVHA